MLLRILATAVCATVITGTASAQSHDNPFRFGTTLSAFAGGAADTEGAAPAAGLNVGWEITRRLAVEGTTLWSNPGNGQHDFSVVLGSKFNVIKMHPGAFFATAGAGMYRATFDSLAGTLPSFYGNRLSASERLDVHGTFDDFVASVGGGAELFVNGHWALRPDVRVLAVFGNSDVRWVTTVGAHLAYHFERHLTSD
jgi:hypothetical protein